MIDKGRDYLLMLPYYKSSSPRLMEVIFKTLRTLLDAKPQPRAAPVGKLLYTHVVRELQSCTDASLLSWVHPAALPLIRDAKNGKRKLEAIGEYTGVVEVRLFVDVCVVMQYLYFGLFV